MRRSAPRETTARGNARATATAPRASFRAAREIAQSSADCARIVRHASAENAPSLAACDASSRSKRARTTKRSLCHQDQSFSCSVRFWSSFGSSFGSVSSVSVSFARIVSAETTLFFREDAVVTNRSVSRSAFSSATRCDSYASQTTAAAATAAQARSRMSFQNPSSAARTRRGGVFAKRALRASSTSSVFECAAHNASAPSQSSFSRKSSSASRGVRDAIVATRHRIFSFVIGNPEGSAFPSEVAFPSETSAAASGNSNTATRGRSVSVSKTAEPVSRAVVPPRGRGHAAKRTPPPFKNASNRSVRRKSPPEGVSFVSSRRAASETSEETSTTATEPSRNETASFPGDHHATLAARPEEKRENEDGFMTTSRKETSLTFRLDVSGSETAHAARHAKTSPAPSTAATSKKNGVGVFSSSASRDVPFSFSNSSPPVTATHHAGG
mmetsp:Transcript_12259/g.51312  ORF Transcript_12259/g.51312 Transcript_12259/m.51312 type:complete len:443 (-) Transcript_12259:146-1474(-)